VEAKEKLVGKCYWKYETHNSTVFLVKYMIVSTKAGAGCVHLYA
jgi:hypothetical protein